MRTLLLLLLPLLSSCSGPALAGLAAGMQQAGGVQPSPYSSQAPYCLDYGYGTPSCVYWSLSYCQDAARMAGGMCIRNPR